MTRFSRKTVSTIEPLGAKLRQARECEHLSLTAVAQRTGIQPKYLASLEHSEYRNLPSDIYVRNFLRTYAALLHLSVESVLELFDRERLVVKGYKAAPPPVELPMTRNVNIARLLRRAVLAAGVLGLLLYLGLKVRTIVEPPPLIVETPSGDIVTDDVTLRVSGSTAAESTVRINGQDVFLDSSGRFSELVDLQPGLNVIKISSRKERSREQIVYRQVVVEKNTETTSIISTTTGTHL